MITIWDEKKTEFSPIETNVPAYEGFLIPSRLYSDWIRLFVCREMKPKPFSERIGF